uniref:Exosome complex component RRP45 n=1 Tax=Ciona savignyi TaxID=51511 RepID=H2YHK9_CIOSA
MPLRDVAFSKREQQFLLQALASNIRVDDRVAVDYRDVSIHFGLDQGCCTVHMGRTKTLAQVTAELTKPKENRPSEGYLGIQIEMSTMAAPNFDPAKQGEIGAGLQQMLERSIIMSRAIDLEELCVRVGEKAWHIQVYIHVLSHDGNILDCACIAAVAALKQFKRPDVSVIGKEFTVHTLEEKNPLYLTMHHMPFCASFAFFQGGEYMVMDPTLNEERVMDGKLMLAVNNHKEVCCLQMSGELQINKEKILTCTNMACVKAQKFSDLVIKSIENDREKRKLGAIRSSTTTSFSKKLEMMQKHTIKTVLPSTKGQNNVQSDDRSFTDYPTPQIPDKTASWLTQHDPNTASIGKGLVNTWSRESQMLIKAFRPQQEESDSDSDNSEEEEVMFVLG